MCHQRLNHLVRLFFYAILQQQSIECISYACAQLAVDPKSCLFVGDDKNDMIAGKNAGIKTVAVTYGFGTVAHTPFSNSKALSA
jgi:phosphoglycolate phosphatase-like HAD superfamily hydrolase